MALQENKAEPKAKDPVKATPSSKGAEKSDQKSKDPAKTESGAKNTVKADPTPQGTGKSGPKAKDSAKTGSESKTPEKTATVLKGVQPEPNNTGQVPVAGLKAEVTNGSAQSLNTTNSTGSASSEGELTGSSGDGYGMYIFLGLLLGLFAYLWFKGHLLAFRKYVMETREQLRKCTWPTRDELYQHTVVVLLSTLMMGVFTVLADQAAALLIWDLLLQVPTSVFGKLLG